MVGENEKITTAGWTRMMEMSKMNDQQAIAYLRTPEAIRESFPLVVTGN